jgi:hypothetical protein
MNCHVNRVLCLVNSLGVLGFSWVHDLGPDLRERIIQRLIKVIPKGGIIALSSCLNGLSGMQYDWNNNGKMEQALSDGIINCYHSTKKHDNDYGAQGISNIIYYLGELSKAKTEYSKICLSKEVHDSFWNGIEKCSDFNGQSVSNVIYG